MRGSQRIEVGGVDLAIYPRPDTETLPLKILKGTVTNAVDGVTGVRQFASQIAADETVGARDPNSHDVALRQRTFPQARSSTAVRDAGHSPKNVAVFVLSLVK
jgi:hypothetical protein